MAIYYVSEAMGQAVFIHLDGDVMTSFTENADNVEWHTYQDWLAEGNTPEPWIPAE